VVIAAGISFSGDSFQLSALSFSLPETQN